MPRAKDRQGVLDYDDLIVKTLALLEKGDAARWVLYKLDNGIDHILIDEAQDTSPEQWRIVRKLAEEFFAGEGRARGTRTIFAVGDEKQSIFSFQGADPSQFDINRHHFERLAAEAEQAFRGPAAGDVAPFRAGNPVFRGHGVRRCSGAGGPHLARPGDRTSRPSHRAPRAGSNSGPR